jgi:hypothetical protein
LEVDELIAEVRRLLPDYIRPFPVTKRINTLRHWWKNDIWSEALNPHSSLHQQVKNSAKFERERFALQQDEMKKSLKGWDPIKTKPSHIEAQFPSDDRRFWGLVDFSRKYQPWRVDSMFWYNYSLEDAALSTSNNDRTIVDWTDPWITIDAFLEDKKRLYKFWLEEVEISRMPRNYTRWAMNFLQPLRKIGSGNSLDVQHSAYLIDADIFFTCDRRYYDCLKIIYNDRVVPIAKPILLPANIENALELIESSV